MWALSFPFIIFSFMFPLGIYLFPWHNWERLFFSYIILPCSVELLHNYSDHYLAL